jgi:putative transposase
MLISLTTLLATLSSIFHSRAALELENLALRHQIGVLQRSARKRLKLTPVDRLLWVGCPASGAIGAGHWPSSSQKRSWLGIARAFVFSGQPGRPGISHEVRDLIRKMCRENSSWGAPRIHGELLKLGIAIGESSVSKYMVRSRKPPSQTWRTFLENHAKELVAIDFFTVPTIRFQVLYVFLVLAHDRRRILHFNVTAHPTAEWTGQQPSASGSAVGCIAVTCAGQSNFDLDGCQANRKSEVIRSRMVPTNVLVFTNIAGVPSS